MKIVVVVSTFVALPAPAQNRTLPALKPPIQAFTCATSHARGHQVQLSAKTRYTPTQAGFDLLPSPTTFSEGACASDQPFFLSVPVPEGNFQVTLTLGSDQPSTTTIRAESRRLFLDRQAIPAGSSKTVIFNVNVRTDEIAGTSGLKVKLKPREIGALDWDSKLTLEFNGVHPALRSLTLRPLPHTPTIYLAGDSTVVDQDKEPWAAWGQMLPVFFGPKVVIANEAESGETIRSFTSEHRLDKILSTIQPTIF
ncbi:MAG: hypothetical protein ABI197_01510 [Granulicella sp.]